MAQMQLAAKVRHETGKGAGRRLRSAGFIPAILYGGATGNVSLTVSNHELFQIVSKHSWETTLIELQFELDGAPKKIAALIKELQTDPVRRTMVHADFMEVTMGHVLEVHVPLNLVGDSPGVKAGGLLEVLLREVMVECLPSNIPGHFEVDISAVNVGDTLTIADLAIAADFKVLDDPETSILTVSAPRAEAEPEEAAEVAEPEVIQKGKKEEE